MYAEDPNVEQDLSADGFVTVVIQSNWHFHSANND